MLMAERMRANETIRFDGRDIPIKQAKKMLADMDETLARESRNVDRQIDNIMAEARVIEEGADRIRLELEDRLPILFNNARAMATWDETMGTALRSHVDGVIALLTRNLLRVLLVLLMRLGFVMLNDIWLIVRYLILTLRLRMLMTVL